MDILAARVIALRSEPNQADPGLPLLPNTFRPAVKAELIRLGGPHDGGYLVEAGSVDRAETLLSFGINDDWAFDADFLRLRRVPLEAFDPSISARIFLRRAAVSLARLPMSVPRPVLAAARVRRDLVTLCGFAAFFRGHRRHHRIAVGHSGEGSMTFSEILDEFAPRRHVFVKCDIEGSEYLILDDLVARSDAISGLVIEFHDVDVHRDRIEDFVRRFPLTLVHAHANNYGGVGADGAPRVIELTFATGNFSPATISLPHPLDAPNNRHVPEQTLTFAAPCGGSLE